MIKRRSRLSTYLARGRYLTMQKGIVGALMCALLTSPVMAQSCQTDVSASVESMSWDSTAKKPQNASLSVYFAGKPPSCAAYIAFFVTQGDAIGFYNGGSNIPAAITDKKGAAYPLHSIDGRQAFLVPVAGKRTQQEWLTLTSMHTPFSGNYLAHIAFGVVEQDYTLVSESSVTASLSVPILFEISAVTSSNPKLSGGKDGFLLDLGVLQTGQQEFWDVQVSSNTHFTLSVASEYGGLQHATSAYQIPYEVAIENRWSDAANPMSINRRIEGEMSTYDITLGIRVGNTSYSTAGKYSDWLIVTASAN